MLVTKAYASKLSLIYQSHVLPTRQLEDGLTYKDHVIRHAFPTLKSPMLRLGALSKAILGHEL